MYNIKDKMVEICGELFPAVNIQIFDFSPVIGYSDDGGHFFPWQEGKDEQWYGIYFELMFESGTNLAVSQEMASALNGNCKTQCSELRAEEFQNHFHVEETHASDNYREIRYAWHCVGEEELYSVLKTMRMNLSAPSPMPEEDAA